MHSISESEAPAILAFWELDGLNQRPTHLSALYLKCSADGVSLVLEGAEFVGESGEAEDVDGVWVGAEEIEPSTHRAARSNEFEIEDGADQAAAKVLGFPRDVAGAELELLLFGADHVRKLSVLRDGELADLEVAVVAIAVDVLDVRAGGRRLDGHFPLGIRDVEDVIGIRIAETGHLGVDRGRGENGDRQRE